MIKGAASLTRVEGEGEVCLILRNRSLVGVELRVTEPPRFFEYLVRGRRAEEVPDIVSRICGLCGVSYALVAAKALERSLEAEIPPEAEELRRALLELEKIKSHVIHVYYLHLPDFLEARTLTSLIERNPLLFRVASRTLLWSRRALEALGGRSHNVVNIRVGGVYAFPRREGLAKLLGELRDLIGSFERLAEAILTLEALSGHSRRYKLLAVYNGADYPSIADEIRILAGDNALDFPVGEFEKMIINEQANYSNALRYRLANGDWYLVGPLARFNIGYEHLGRETKELLSSYGWRPPLGNIFQSIIARIAEIYNALTYLAEFLEAYREPSAATPYREPRIGPGSYCAALEAPRGTLYHRYDVDESGKIARASIITPTAQNQLAIENVILEELVGSLDEDKALDTARRVVRSFDPCLSCSVHLIALDTPR